MEDEMSPSTPEQTPEQSGSGTLATFLDGTDRPDAMQYAYREMLTPRMIRVVLAALTAVVGVFTIIGPLSTYETLPPFRRLEYWSLWYFVAWPVCFLVAVVTLYWLRDRTPRTASLGLAGATLIAAVPATGIVCTIEDVMRPECMAGLLMIYIRVVAVTMPFTLLLHFIVLQRVKLNGAAPAETTGQDRHPRATGNGELVHPRMDDGVRKPAGDAGAEAPAASGSSHRVAERVSNPMAGSPATPLTRPRSVFDRLPRKLGTDLIYLKVEDHYVEAHTPAGSGLILMRFADAVAELSAHGLQVHRSYWVARRYMKRVMPKDGRTFLRLTTGQDIPVSRTYLHAVRAALGDAASMRPT
ncbi:MAG: LytTR family DNA-binding domain-containing protein [Spirochaetaceae bacterium]|nr:LytTR family DNA-binding domain-containing protein [Spirochaetaceae bacterium]